MAKVTARLDTRQWQRALKRLRTETPKAARRSLNRAAVAAKTEMARETSRELGLKVTDAKATMSIENATDTNLVATLTSKGERIPLTKLGAKGPEPSRGRGRGVTTRFPGMLRLPKAFIAKIDGARGVFEREGLKRFPVKEHLGPSVPETFMKVAPKGMARAVEQMRTTLSHELGRLLARIRK